MAGGAGVARTALSARYLITISFRDLSGPACLSVRSRRRRVAGRLAGDHDRAFTDARLAEIRRLLDDEKLRGHGVLAERVSAVTAYEQQSARLTRRSVRS